MPDILALSQLPVVLAPPPLTLNGQSFPGGTVMAALSVQRAGDPLPGCVWHAKVDPHGRWSHPIEVRPAHGSALTGTRMLWLVVTWAGREVGAWRVTVGR